MLVDDRVAGSRRCDDAALAVPDDRLARVLEGTRGDEPDAAGLLIGLVVRELALGTGFAVPAARA